MRSPTTFGETRRGRRRGQTRWGAVRLAAAGLLVAAAALAGYHVARSQARVEGARLAADLAGLQELNRLLGERTADAEQRAEAAVARSARLRQSFEASLPRADIRALVDLLETRLRAGVPPERLAFVLREARQERRCAPGIDARRLPVHTSTSTVPPSVVAFAKDRITVSAEGSPVRRPPDAGPAAAPFPTPGFDPAQPVSLRFLKIGRDVTRAEGLLPLSHAVVLGDQEFLFTVRPADKAPGQVEVVAQACAYP